MSRSSQRPVKVLAIRAWIVSLCVASLGFVAYGDSSSGHNNNDGSGAPVRVGSWGGDHIAMQVSAAAVSLEFDCAYGRIDEPLRTDADGRFEVRGVLMFEAGGPVASDQPPPTPHAAIYRGRVDAEQMTLTVLLDGWGTKPFGTFELRFNYRPELEKCL